MNRALWDELMGRLGLGPNAEMFERLEAAYAESHRHYHTSEHIDFCLDLLHEDRALAPHPDRVELAIWFHDAIYKTSSKKNEEKSADLARSFLLENGVDSAIAESVYGLILATTHDAPVTGTDAEVLVDIDLAILGSDEETFWRFEKNVRKEYQWVPSFLYRKERRKVLESFLDRQSIYACDSFRSRFEAQARMNIESAIARL